MASVSKLPLYADVLSATQTTSSKSLQGRSNKFIAVQAVSVVAGGGTVQATLEHSPNGTDWITFAALPVRNAAGVDVIYENAFSTANQPLFPNVRAVVTKGGGGTVTCDISLYFDENR